MLSVLLTPLASPPWWLAHGHSYAGSWRANPQRSGTPLFYDEQCLDHSAPNDERLERLWSQRYYEDLTSWGGAGYPVFISLGGEGPAYGPPSGLQQQLAETHRAALITLEHRFYGESWPTENMSAANLRHLSADQALADAVQFIAWWSEEHGSLNSSWVSWGGSYSGQLSAWLRLRYPTSVAGAVAYSAPVLSQLDFFQYDEVTTAVLSAMGGAVCTQRLRQAFEEAVAALAEDAPPGRDRAIDLLHACTRPNSTDDDAILTGSAMGRVQSLVQYNDPSSAHSIASFCAAGEAAAKTGASALEALGAMLREMSDRRCLVSSLEAYMAPLRDANFTTGTPTIRQYYWQLCNEFGQQTCEPGGKGCAEGVEPPPAPTVFAPLLTDDDLTAGLSLCVDLYNATAMPPAQWTGRQRGWTNIVHGGRELCASAIIFINGRNDPYSSVSLLPEQLSPAQAKAGMLSVAVTNASHCVGMDAMSSSDSTELKAAKRQIARVVAAWLE